jgi:hypothetical protein
VGHHAIKKYLETSLNIESAIELAASSEEMGVTDM